MFRFIALLVTLNVAVAYSDRGILKLDNTCAALGHRRTWRALTRAFFFARVQHL